LCLHAVSSCLYHTTECLLTAYGRLLLMLVTVKLLRLCECVCVFLKIFRSCVVFEERCAGILLMHYFHLLDYKTGEFFVCVCVCVCYKLTNLGFPVLCSVFV